MRRYCKGCKRPLLKQRDHMKEGVCRLCAENGTRHYMRDANTADRRDGRVVRKRIGEV